MVTYDIYDIWTDNFKNRFREKIDKVFEKKFGELGMWGRCKTNNKDGVLTSDNKWHPQYNRPNTNSYFVDYMIQEMLFINQTLFRYLGVKIYDRVYAEKIGDFIEENFDTYFTRKNGSEKYNEVLIILKKSWFYGVVTEIGAILTIKKVFTDIKKIHYTFNAGDNDDFNGIDVSVDFLNSNETLNFQVKTGYIEKTINGEEILTGSINHLNYPKCQYYIYTKVSHGTSVIFRNTPLVKRYENKNNKIRVPSHLIIFNDKVDMTIPNYVDEIGKLCFSNNLNIEIITDGDSNFINIGDIDVIINLTDFDDKNLENLLESSLKKLKDRFNVL